MCVRAPVGVILSRVEFRVVPFSPYFKCAAESQAQHADGLPAGELNAGEAGSRGDQRGGRDPRGVLHDGSRTRSG